MNRSWRGRWLRFFELLSGGVNPSVGAADISPVRGDFFVPPERGNVSFADKGVTPEGQGGDTAN